MDFYSTIHHVYDEIFPFVPAQRDFVLSYGSGPDLGLVDVGCGTGSLLVSLAADFGSCAGLDPDESMLAAARKKAASKDADIRLIKAGMLDLAREFPPRSVDRLICFGNTLPHLDNENEVMQFVRQASEILKTNGLLLIQMINYDRILDQKLGGLPTIESDDFKFERIYEYPGNPVHIRFITRLTVKATGQVIANEVPLLAIRPAMLRQILEKSGFAGYAEFGNFNKDPLTINSQPFIVKARAK